MTDEPRLTEEQLNEGMFMSLVLSLNTAAMCQLGKMADPFTGKQERDLARAKGSIDMLRMIKAKTAGNLAEKESQLLEQSITNLQINYVEEMKKDAASSAETPQPDSGQAVSEQKSDTAGEGEKPASAKEGKPKAEKKKPAPRPSSGQAAKKKAVKKAKKKS